LEMPSGYDLVLQRIEWAKEQRRDLEREMRAWTEAGAYGVGSQLDPQTGYTVYYVGHLADITPRIVALISEILHTLRTTLDNLAYQLFLVCRTDPADEGEGIYFPIYDDAKTKETDAFGKIKPFRKEIIEAVRKVNPCKSGQPLLWILHRLDIVNKHRRILVEILVNHSVFVREAMRQMLIEQGHADMASFVAFRPAVFTSAKTGRKAQVGDVLFTAPPDTSEEMKKKLHFTCDIAFDEPGIIEGKSVVETIDEMLKLIEGFLPNFTPFLL
jgi:hypothetical protein